MLVLLVLADFEERRLRVECGFSVYNGLFVHVKELSHAEWCNFVKQYGPYDDTAHVSYAEFAAKPGIAIWINISHVREHRLFVKLKENARTRETSFLIFLSNQVRGNGPQGMHVVS